MLEKEGIINRRIVSNESFGIVKYVGPLEGQPGGKAFLHLTKLFYQVSFGSDDWYGVDWEDVTRGKHDGSFKGKRYFETKHPTSGSFLKQNKVELGVDIFRAAQERYLEDADDTDGGGGKKVDANGNEFLYDASRLVERLSCVSLAYCKINSASSVEKFKATFEFIKEIDLEGNLFHSWSQIFDILNCLQCVRLLNVSNNRLELVKDSGSQLVYPKIDYLVLNKMGYNWADVMKVTRHFPRLNLLKACFNEITKIDELSENLESNLKVLDLESNSFDDWENLAKLGELKQLEHLYINHVGISSVYFNDVEFNCDTKFFPKLKSIALNENKIDNWATMNELNKLSGLEEIRFKANPLNETDSTSNIIQLFTAKIKRLRILNRTEIDAKVRGHTVTNDRKGAEFDYMKKYWKDYLEIKDCVGQEKYRAFFVEHPRYMEFVKNFGMLELSEVTVIPDTVKSSLISINIVNDVTKEKLVRKLPLSMTIQRIKGVISKLFISSGFAADFIELVYVSGKQVGDNYELENDFRDLKFYSVEEGDTIVAKLPGPKFYVRKHYNDD